MAQPGTDPSWNTGGANRSAPLAGKLISGHVANGVYSSSEQNWLLFWICQWIAYLKNLAGEAFAWTAAHTFAPSSGTNVHAIASTGRGTGQGISAVGGASGAGVGCAPGTAATATVPQNALLTDAGNIGFVNAVNPNSDVGFANTLTPKNTIKAWAILNVGGGSVVVEDGFNISAAAVNNTNFIRVTFTTAMATGTYAVQVNSTYLGSQTMSFILATSCRHQTTTFDIAVYNTSLAAAVDLTSAALQFSFTVLAKQ